MSEFSEEKNVRQDISEQKPEAVTEQESTLFSNPEEQLKKKKPIKTAKLWQKTVSAVCAVILVAGAIFAVIRLVPKKEEESGTTSSGIALGNIKVTEYSSDDVKKLTVQGDSFGKAVLCSKSTESEDASNTVWYLDGVDETLTSSVTVANAVNSAVALNAVKKMTNTEADYGFDSPYATAEVESNGTFENYSITVGNESPDKSGHYVKTSLSENIYLVDNVTVDDFCKDIYSYSTTTAVNALTENDQNKDYFANNTLNYVDSITAWGTKFSQKLSFIKNPEIDTAPFMAYTMTSPKSMYCNNERMNELLSPVISGIVCEKCYSFSATAAELAKYKLDNPEICINIKLPGTDLTVKASEYEEGYYALTVDGSNGIFKVAESSLVLSDTTAESFFSDCIFIEKLQNFKNITVFVEKAAYSFDITYNENAESDQDTFTIKAGNKKIKTENFQNYYQQLLSVTVSDFNVSGTGTKEMTISATRCDGTKVDIEFAKVSDMRYEVSLSGHPIGKISTTDYDHLVKYAKDVYNNKSVPGLS